MLGRDIAISAAGAVVQAVAIAGTYALLRRYMPARVPGLTPARVAELRKKYRWFDLTALVPFFGLTALLTWGIFVALRRGMAWAVARRESGEFHLSADPVALLIPAMFLAMFAAAGPLWLLVRVLLRGAAYREYMTYSRYGQGFDGLRALALLAALIVPASVALAAMIVDQYAVVTKSELVVNPFFGFTEHRRRLEDVAAAHAVRRFRAPSGKVVERPHHVIRFRDGSTWSTRDGGRTPRFRDDARLVSYVAGRAGVPIQSVDSVPGG